MGGWERERCIFWERLKAVMECEGFRTENTQAAEFRDLESEMGHISVISGL